MVVRIRGKEDFQVWNRWCTCSVKQDVDTPVNDCFVSVTEEGILGLKLCASLNKYHMFHA